jgi:hypothetical protein
MGNEQRIMHNSQKREFLHDDFRKIPKTDKRLAYIEYLLSRRKYCVHEFFYKTDGEFRGKVFISETNTNLQFALHSCTKMFIEYVFGNIRTGIQTNIRFWIENGKCEEHINGHWVVKIF